MVAPTAGPFPKPIANSLSSYREKLNYTQQPPYNLSLLYYLSAAWCKSPPANANLGMGAQWFGPDNSYHVCTAQAGYSDVIGGAYARLVGAISNSAQLGATLAEGRQSMGMMLGRVGQLIDFTKAVRRLDFVHAARVVNLAIVPKGVSAKKSLANNWLEYSFGWSPLIQDIYNAADHLQNPIKSVRPNGKSDATHYKMVESGSISSGFFSRRSIFGKRYAKMGCEVTINNPNLYLLNKLGLANPASVAWELIPFSFVVDWFTTVGEFLSSGTDFLGLTVSNPWTVFGTKGQAQDHRGNPFWVPPRALANWDVAHMQRLPSLVGPMVKIRPARLWGWQRVANATSVLTQLLSKR